MRKEIAKPSIVRVLIIISIIIGAFVVLSFWHSKTNDYISTRLPEEVSPITVGNPEAVFAMRDAYKSGLDWGKIPNLDEFRDSRVIRLIADWSAIPERLYNETGIAVQTTGEDAGYYEMQIRKFTGQSLHNLRQWYSENKYYIYWDENEKSFNVNVDAKQKGAIVDPVTGKSLSEKQLEEIRALENEFDDLREVAYRVMLARYRR